MRRALAGAAAWLREGERAAHLIRDAFIFGGLGFAVWGGWQLSPPWTAVVCGAILAGLGILAPAFRGRPPS